MHCARLLKDEAYLILSNHDDHRNRYSTLNKVLARFDIVPTTFFDFAGDEVMLLAL
jgi:hypothetical protein